MRVLYATEAVHHSRPLNETHLVADVARVQPASKGWKHSGVCWTLPSRSSIPSTPTVSSRATLSLAFAQHVRCLPCQPLCIIVHADEQSIERFNNRTAAAQAAIDTANVVYANAVENENHQQNITFKARDDFRIAGLHLADQTSLCNQPQPPSNCAEGLREAVEAVQRTNSTKNAENAHLVEATAATADAYDQQQEAEAAYETVVEMQDQKIRSMQAQIQLSSHSVQLATAAWVEADEKCNGRR